MEEEKSKVKVTRYGNYITTIDNTLSAIRRFIIDNIPPIGFDEGISDVRALCESTTMDECLDVAKFRHYEFIEI